MVAQLQATDVDLRVLTVRKTLALVSPQLGSPLSKRKSDRQEVRLLRTCFPYSLCMVVNFSQHSDCKDAVLVKCHKVKAKWVRLHSKKGEDYHDWIVHNLRKEWQGCIQEPVDKQEEHAGNAELFGIECTMACTSRRKPRQRLWAKLSGIWDLLPVKGDTRVALAIEASE